ncbi:LysE family translocator [Desulfocurvibacter africanus]|uniref:LysE family translocator n=1 Tax=Desulfocurvibacter africanus TaxID=873 RepID=UPI000486D966|nr:LysE family translocator [Desulfocurvibacter africanus]
MESILALAGILLAVLLAAMSPGPSFLAVARISISESRANGIAAAVGMGLGAVTLAILALLGLTALFKSVPWLYVALKLAGGTYLVYIGISIWRGAKKPLCLQPTGAANNRSWWSALRTALCIQLSNPKAAVFYGSIFATLLPKHPSLTVTLMLPLLVLLIEISWYFVVALLLSASGPRCAYLRAKLWIDRLAGGVMGLLGVKLIASTDGLA